MDRAKQMKVLLILTSVSLIPVYILIGWQSGGHGPNSVATWFWYTEAVAWGIRSLVESMALIYLFSTYTDDPKAQRKLAIFETALIVLIGVTVTLLVISNGSKNAISNYGLFFYIWAASVAAFAPLMLGSVGFAFKVHKALPLMPSVNEVDALAKKLNAINKRIDDLELTGNDNSVIARRLRVSAYKKEGLTRPKMAELENVSEATIGLDIKAMGLNGK